MPTPSPPTPIPVGSVEGIVSDASTGAPVPGAQVTIAGRVGVLTLATGDDGKYEVAALPTGPYLISVQSTAYCVTTTQVSVMDNVASSGNISLESAVVAAALAVPTSTPMPAPTAPSATPTPTIVASPIPTPMPGSTREVSEERIWARSIIEPFTIHELSYDQRPFNYNWALNWSFYDCNKIPFIDGVPVTLWTDFDGVNRYYVHPVRNATIVLSLLATYMSENDKRYLSAAELFAKNMLQKTDVVDDAIFFPYKFDCMVYVENEMIFRALWYSGMAQGMWLSVYARLYDITDKVEYMDIAEQVFESLDTQPGDPVWVAGVDERGYYWIEEYPMQPWDHTLNGFMEAVVTGLYDYYMVKKDAESKAILQATITTIRHYLPEYRVEKGISLYSLIPLVNPVQSRGYHIIHIRELSNLYDITRDDYFRDMAGAFYHDAVADTAARLGNFEGVSRVGDAPQDSEQILAFVSTPFTTPSQDIFDPPAGSLAFWFSPQWDAGGEAHHYILDTRANGDDRLLYLYYDYLNDSFVWRGGQSSPQSFKSGEWLHIVLAWDERETRIYVNGKQSGQSGKTAVGEAIILGNNWSGSFPCDCMMSELVALDRPLNSEEVRVLYSLSLETLPGTR